MTSYPPPPLPPPPKAAIPHCNTGLRNVTRYWARQGAAEEISWHDMMHLASPWLVLFMDHVKYKDPLIPRALNCVIKDQTTIILAADEASLMIKFWEKKIHFIISSF